MVALKQQYPEGDYGRLQIVVEGIIGGAESTLPPVTIGLRKSVQDCYYFLEYEMFALKEDIIKYFFRIRDNLLKSDCRLDYLNLDY